jgi:hypothetical protein
MKQSVTKFRMEIDGEPQSGWVTGMKSLLQFNPQTD